MHPFPFLQSEPWGLNILEGMLGGCFPGDQILTL